MAESGRSKADLWNDKYVAPLSDLGRPLSASGVIPVCVLLLHLSCQEFAEGFGALAGASPSPQLVGWCCLFVFRLG